MTHGKRVAIIQSNYIPWKGYFDIIGSVDEFILLDTVQYTRRDWRNRNLIKTPRGPQWLTIPVEVKGNYTAPIREVRVADPTWNRQHWDTLRQNYASAPGFSAVKDQLADLYLRRTETFLSEINFHFLSAISGWLGISTPLTWAHDYQVAAEGASERLLSLCQQAGASVYVSGPAARDYLDTDLLARGGVAVEWVSYDNYPAYHQAHPPFVHGVSIVDLLCNEGANARSFLKSTVPS